MIQCIEGLEKLYEVCAKLEGINYRELTLVSCDSGGDKVFGFLGEKKSVQKLRSIILSAWNRAVYYDETREHERIKLISRSLPVLEEISDLAKKKKISPEESEQSRKATMLGATKFCESGAIIPEIKEHTSYEPRNLMGPSPKLLPSPTQKKGAKRNPKLMKKKIHQTTTVKKMVCCSLIQTI